MSEEHASDPSPTDEPAPGPDALRRTLETVVYGPIGMALTAAEDLPGLVAKGRARVEQEISNARLVGKFVLERGHRELRQRLRDALDNVDNPPSTSTPSTRNAATTNAVTPFDDSPAPTDLTPETASASRAAAMATAANKPAPDPADGAAVERALADYDTLSASQVVRRLEGLRPEELRAVHRHEASHRNRRTILNRTSQLLEEGGAAAASALD